MSPSAPDLLRRLVRDALRREATDRVAAGEELVDGAWLSAPAARMARRRAWARAVRHGLEGLALAAGVGLVGLALAALAYLVVAAP